MVADPSAWGGRDQAFGAFATGLSSTYPEVAAQWAGQIADEATRYRSLEGIARRWLEQDPWAASAMLQSAPLPPERKARLLPPVPGK